MTSANSLRLRRSLWQSRQKNTIQGAGGEPRVQSVLSFCRRYLCYFDKIFTKNIAATGKI
nr:MAG TPA: hypothetical protein [Caudoviricetes sp.]